MQSVIADEPNDDSELVGQVENSDPPGLEFGF